MSINISASITEGAAYKLRFTPEIADVCHAAPSVMLVDKYNIAKMF
jgi:hypothetical protein